MRCLEERVSLGNDGHTNVSVFVKVRDVTDIVFFQSKHMRRLVLAL